MTTKRIENLHLHDASATFTWRIEINGCAVDLADGKAFIVARVGESMSVSIADAPESSARPAHGWVWQMGDDEVVSP